MDGYRPAELVFVSSYHVAVGGQGVVGSVLTLGFHKPVDGASEAYIIQ